MASNDENERRARAGMRLALALIAAHARGDDAAIRVLIADCLPDQIVDALRCSTAMAWSAMVGELLLAGVPDDELAPFLQRRLLQLEGE